RLHHFTGLDQKLRGSGSRWVWWGVFAGRLVAWQCVLDDQLSSKMFPQVMMETMVDKRKIV
ncbi:hypothetical protein, partial [Corynebacterium sp. HMSC08F01]|uniref:hypothetical protein n=1 Tax=Corynebacterium sp. HMSC08F01 TaxID=1581139 RepID=UPI001AEF7B0C